jgi:hypothetical protein
MTISQDSSVAVTVTKADDNESWIKMYSLLTHEVTFEEKIGGGINQVIKVKEVEKNPDNIGFAVAYSDDGKFRLRTFGRQSRTPQEIEDNEVKINEILGMDNYTMTNDDFSDPFITCCWIDPHRLFVNLFHSYTCTHHHFIWDDSLKKLIGTP